MSTSRRGFFKALSVVGATAAAGALPASAAKERREPPSDAVGMLYDTTRCIGCKACVVACREANGLEPDTRHSEGELHDAPISLSSHTKNIIKLHKGEKRTSYMKQQCMHCVDAACVGACMIGALQKREFGIVTWDGGRCIGCRYCQVACPFNIPKFEWEKANPKIVKCEMCNHLLAEGKIPACCEVCPRDAVIFGTREELLADAKQRLADNPGKYVPRVYGETDAGGTQVLYVSHVPFEELGLPELGDEAVPSLNRELQHGIYQGFAAPAALYALLGAVAFRNRRAQKKEDGHD